MSKSSESPREVTLEYVGPPHRYYRDLPALDKGELVKVSRARSKSLLATKCFKEVKTKTADKPAVKE